MLSVQDKVVAMDQLVTAGIAENLRNFRAFMPRDQSRALPVVGADADSQRRSFEIAYFYSVSAIEHAIDLFHAGRQEAFTGQLCMLP